MPLIFKLILLDFKVWKILQCPRTNKVRNLKSLANNDIKYLVKQDCMLYVHKLTMNFV